MVSSRITTGVERLDEEIEQGFPEGSVILVSGPAGAGKTLFGLQFLYKNALQKRGGAYFSFEEAPDDLKEEALKIGLPFNKVDGVEFYRLTPFPYQDLLATIRDTLKKKKIKVAVLDNLSTLTSFSEFYVSVKPMDFGLTQTVQVKGEAAVKAMLYDLMQEFKDAGVTAVWCSELPKEFLYFSRDTESEFMADGIILLNRVTLSRGSIRLLTIEKMRKTNHSLERFPLEITEKGLIIKAPESAVGKGMFG